MNNQPYYKEEVLKARTKKDIIKIYPDAKFFKETQTFILGELDPNTYVRLSKDRLNIKVEKIMFGIGGQVIENNQ